MYLSIIIFTEIRWYYFYCSCATCVIIFPSDGVLNSSTAERNQLLLSDKCNAAGPPSCAASASATSITAGSSVDFFDNSTGGPDTWSWDFGGGATPNTSEYRSVNKITFSYCNMLFVVNDSFRIVEIH